MERRENENAGGACRGSMKQYGGRAWNLSSGIAAGAIAGFEDGPVGAVATVLNRDCAGSVIQVVGARTVLAVSKLFSGVFQLPSLA